MHGSGITSTANAIDHDTVKYSMKIIGAVQCIKKNCQSAHEARKVAKQVMSHCKERYVVSPQNDISDCTPDQFTDLDLTYVPHHLQYIRICCLNC